MDAARIAQALIQAGLPMTGPQTVISHGKSGDLVARCGEVFVKLAGRSQAGNAELLVRETEVLTWLAGKVVVPEVLWWGDCGDDLALVTRAALGVPVSHVTPDQARDGLIATILSLSVLHGLPLAACPFDQRLSAKLAQAEARLAAGEVDETDFDAERLGLTAHQAWTQLQDLIPASEDLVLTHGDASLPNFIWDGQGGVTLIDLGRFGIADRHQDLALFLRSARHNHPQIDALALLARHYSGPAPDPARLAFYHFLDEFF